MSSAWKAYRPDAATPWNVRRVVHLHRRAGFAATWREIQRDLADGPEAAVGRLLHGRARLDGQRAEFSARADALADAAVIAEEIERLQAWWLFRMLFTPDPLGERLTLMWHNHFATSHAKVRSVATMRHQNDAQRTFCRAPFGELLGAMVRDPALLVWLDAPLNRKGKANENLGRELMELFTLGIGNFSERDVKEASRALTGWSVSPAGFKNRPENHDDGEKSILGQTGQWGTDDLARIVLEHPATSRRLAMRLCEAFMGEHVVGDDALEALAASLRQDELHIGRAVEKVLRSEAFFSDANIASRVAAPPEFLVSAVRALELFEAPPSTLLLAEWLRRAGQDLFRPPNVGGWAGGRAWLTSRGILARANFAAALVSGELTVAGTPPDLAALARRHDAAPDAAFFRRLLLGESGPSPGAAGGDLNEAVALILASPEAQLA